MGEIGIIRKVDELGRIVIPKEIRKILDIKTGSSLEICVNENKQIIFKKFSEVENLVGSIGLFLESFFATFQIPILLCDEEKVVYVVGVNKKEFLNNKVVKDISDFDCKDGKLYNGDIVVGQKSKFEDSLIVCLFSDGCLTGKLILIKKEEGITFSGEVLSSLKLLTDYISRLFNFE